MSSMPETATTTTATTMPETATPTAPAEKLALTDKAVEQIKAIQQQENLTAHVLRISVVGGGCSGMSYRMGFVESANPGDHVVERDGVKVVVDPKSMLYLAGTTVDFSDGLQGKGFTFGNPNAKRTCGCGSSFSG